MRARRARASWRSASPRAWANIYLVQPHAESADAAGARLTTAGITGKGMLSFFKTLQQQEYRYGVENIDPFMQTHPLSGDRIAHLTADLQASPAWNKPTRRWRSGSAG